MKSIKIITDRQQYLDTGVIEAGEAHAEGSDTFDYYTGMDTQIHLDGLQGWGDSVAIYKLTEDNIDSYALFNYLV